MQFVIPTFGEDSTSYNLCNIKFAVNSDNSAVCHDEIENQPGAACSGSPHDNESSDYFSYTTSLFPYPVLPIQQLRMDTPKQLYK